ncbi:MAG TPA: glycosyltransferase [Mycobacteriales bacterium]|nr:glycosyltransferase [Mycobacteriales bacterium]
MEGASLQRRDRTGPPSVEDVVGTRKIAIAHEWVDAYAGSEQVFEAFARIFPNADLYALSRRPSISLDVGSRDIRTTFLDTSMFRNRRAATLPLMPLAWRALRAPEYDLVISSHHAFAHANRLAGRSGRHLCYVHSPARYVWTPEIDGRGGSRMLKPARDALRRVDRRFSRKVDSYAANSTAVAARIQSFWGRTARVIHPPVRVEYFAEGAPKVPTRDYVLGVGRWIGYKNLDLVIRAAERAGLPVKLAGRGPDRERLLAAAREASVPVELIESPSDEELRSLYQNARCLVFPTIEDFGLIPVEAQAAGTPVVAPAAGGVIDTVVNGRTGVLVDGLDPDRLAAAIHEADAIDPAACREHATRFGFTATQDAVVAWVSSELLKPSRDAVCA